MALERSDSHDSHDSHDRYKRRENTKMARFVLTALGGSSICLLYTSDAADE